MRATIPTREVDPHEVEKRRIEFARRFATPLKWCGIRCKECGERIPTPVPRPGWVYVCASCWTKDDEAKAREEPHVYERPGHQQ